MNILKYSKTTEKKIHRNPEVYMDLLRKKIQENLRKRKIGSEIVGDTIVFKRTIEVYDRSYALKSLRNGQIRIRKIGFDQIELFWEVELDGLLLLSVTIGTVLGIILGLFAETQVLMILSALIIGLFISTVAYLFGLNSILTSMDEILDTDA
jgi:hypothetical protein